MSCPLRPTNLEAERSALLPHAQAFERYRQRIDELKINCFRCAEGTDGPN